MPKSRGFQVCECCKAPISTGKRYVVYAGRPWLMDHLDVYRARTFTSKK